MVLHLEKLTILQPLSILNDNMNRGTKMRVTKRSFNILGCRQRVRRHLSTLWQHLKKKKYMIHILWSVREIEAIEGRPLLSVEIGR